MILEPRKSAEEIDRRLSALTDPELSALLQNLRDGFSSDDEDSYTSPQAPYWKRRIGLLALAGLFAMSSGFGFVAFQPASHTGTKAKAAVAPAPVRKHTKNVARHVIPAVHVAPAAARVRAPILPAVTVTPNETLIRQARAQLLHERALAAAAQAETARAQYEARVAVQAKADAQARAHAEAVAQAQAEAVAQSRTEALQRAQAQAQAQAQDEQTRGDTLAREAAEQQWVRDHTSGPGTKSAGPPSDTGTLSTGPSPRMPLPMPGPIDPNCTPHRGSLFMTLVAGAALSHVRVGGTNAGNLLRMVNP